MLSIPPTLAFKASSALVWTATRFQMDIRQITSTSSADFEGACASLPASFGGDHISRAINGGDLALEAARIRASITTSVLDLEAYVASSTVGGPVQAVMLVKPPGMAHGVSPNAKGPHAQAVDAMITDPALRDAGKQLFAIFHDVEQRAFGPRCVTDMYYVSHLGVDASARGQGLGTALIRHIVKRAHGEDVPVCLLTMTEKNEALYRYLGFKSGAYLEADVRGIPTQWWAMKTDLPIPAPREGA